ncbi:MAG TPA: FAD binding domain-containing protein, partial [Pseudonocardiaceae bacterium]|nr:FAD binding domain-containing protein [Pseudonocardiaceae bacterium]
MIPADFDYVRAGSVDEAVALLASDEDAKLIAGGHSLLPMMKLRLAFPSVLVDVRRLPGLSYVRTEGDEIAIGALTRHCGLVESTVLRAEAPLLAEAASFVGDPQIRHRGTIGGSLSHADPAADLPAAVLASDATLVVRGPAGRRSIAAADFFVDYFQTALRPDEMLVEVRVPRTGPNGWHYSKFVRRANDWAIVAVATVAGRVALAG